MCPPCYLPLVTSMCAYTPLAYTPLAYTLLVYTPLAYTPLSLHPISLHPLSLHTLCGLHPPWSTPSLRAAPLP